MARVRLDRRRSEGRLHAGIRCHIETDEAFHSHATFRGGSAAIRRDLAPLDLPVGATRAIGHIGWELLLDGALVGSRTESAFHHALMEGDEARSAIVADDRLRWRA